MRYKVCSQCSKFVKASSSSEVLQGAPKLRVDRVKTTLSKCGLTGEYCQRNTEACSSFKEG